MSYPTINARPGTAERNLGPVTDALVPLIADSLHAVSHHSGHPSSSTGTSSGSGPTASRNGVHILELASYPYTHIRSWAQRWPEVDWWGSVRDQDQLEEITGALKQEDQKGEGSSNLRPPRRLDVQMEEHWRDLNQVTEAEGLRFSGAIMLNLIHCCPPDVPEEIFKHLARSRPHPESNNGEQSSDGGAGSATGRRGLLHPIHGWIAAYGPWLNDDGTYRSQADKDFEASHIKANSPSCGLRSVPAITAIAEKYGFIETSVREMPSGNLFVVWRASKVM